MQNKIEAGRLALRVEGDMWNAYFVRSKANMAGAILIGSIRLNAVTDRPARKAEFMQMMIDAVSDAIREVARVSPTWGEPVTASESERSGRA